MTFLITQIHYTGYSSYSKYIVYGNRVKYQNIKHKVKPVKNGHSQKTKNSFSRLMIA